MIKQTLRIETSCYNERRYGKPWIAIMDFTSPSKPEYLFGDFLGAAGDAGELSVDVEPGDVVARGQKDNRKGRGGADGIGVVQADYSVEWGFTPAKARDAGAAVRASLADVKPSHPLAAFTSEELRAELDRREAEMAVA